MFFCGWDGGSLEDDYVDLSGDLGVKLYGDLVGSVGLYLIHLHLSLVDLDSCPQTKKYKESVLPANVKARLAVEAGATQCWYKYVGLDGKIIGIDHFGESGPYKPLFQKYGFTVDNVVAQAKALLNK